MAIVFATSVVAASDPAKAYGAQMPWDTYRPVPHYQPYRGYYGSQTYIGNYYPRRYFYVRRARPAYFYHRRYRRY